MFLEKKILKRMMKKAFKTTGLRVGHSNDGVNAGVYISGVNWAVWLKDGFMPKEIKAAVIEICGELPENEQFIATKAGLQYETPDDLYNLPRRFTSCDTRLDITRFMRASTWGEIRFLQREDLKVFALQNEFIELTEGRELDESEETPKGPVKDPLNDNFIFWGNDRCYLLAAVMKPNDEKEIEMWQHLERIKID